jgi:hypothetical protein
VIRSKTVDVLPGQFVSPGREVKGECFDESGGYCQLTHPPLRADGFIGMVRVGPNKG